MTGIHQVLVSMGGSSIQEFSFLVSSGDPVDRTTYTFASQTLGTADTNRRIFAMVVNEANAFQGVPTSVTIGGVSATSISSQLDAFGSTAISLWTALVPTGTTGDVVVTHSTTKRSCAISLYRTVGASASLSASGTSDISGNPSVAVAIPAGGIGLAAITNPHGPGPFVWTNYTENAEGVIETGNLSASFASYDNHTGGGQSITATVTDNQATGTALLLVCTIAPV